MQQIGPYLAELLFALEYNDGALVLKGVHCKQQSHLLKPDGTAFAYETTPAQGVCTVDRAELELAIGQVAAAALTELEQVKAELETLKASQPEPEPTS